ncbi:hypothetical protein QFZ71_000855 [Streptomyces sp. V2I9]|nr:hypothetical protein [Streptomyces sp. V2I9]
MQGELHRRPDPGVVEDLGGLGGAGLAVLVEEGVGVPGDAGRDQRVERLGGGAVDLLRDPAPVDDLRHGLPHRLGDHRVLGVEAEVADGEAGQFGEIHTFLRRHEHGVGLLGRHGPRHEVDLLLVERLAHGSGIGEEVHLDLVVEHLQLALVRRVPGEFDLDDAAVLDLRLHGVRAGTVHLEAGAGRLRRVLRLRDDAGGRGGELVREGRVGRVQVEDHLVLALGLDHVDVGEQADGPAFRADVDDALDGVLHVLGGDGRPVGEREARPQGAAVALVRGVGEGAAAGGLGHRLAAAAGHGGEGLHGLPQDVPDARLVADGRVERRGVLPRGDELVRGADDDGALAIGATVRAAAGGEHGGEQADDGRQHQGLAVHLDVLPHPGR